MKLVSGKRHSTLLIRSRLYYLTLAYHISLRDEFKKKKERKKIVSHSVPGMYCMRVRELVRLVIRLSNLYANCVIG